VLICLQLASAACASQSATLGASFTPYRLGGRTTIELSFQIKAAAGEIPSALTEIEVRYPQNLGFALSGLGLDVCSAALLEATGTREGHIALLLYASGPSPVNTQILSPAQLLPASAPFGGSPPQPQLSVARKSARDAMETVNQPYRVAICLRFGLRDAAGEPHFADGISLSGYRTFMHV
jgi:hypothetical protein